MNQVKKSVKYVIKRATQKESVNPPVGTAKNQATGIGIALKRRTEAEARVEGRIETIQTQEKETNQIKERTLLIPKTEKTIRVARIIASGMTPHQKQSLKMTEHQIPGQGQTPQSQAQKMKPHKKERNQKEVVTRDTTRTIE